MPSVHVAQGLTGVILCGPGSSLSPLSSPVKLPKPLLPIGNKPMIQYSLEWLQDGGITNVIIVCMSEHEASLTSYVKTLTEKTEAPSGKQPASKPILRFKPKVIATAQVAAPLTTAAVLRLPQVRNHIKSDFILLPCDLVCEIPLGVLVNHWMAQPTGHGAQKGCMGVYYHLGTETKGLEKDVIVTTQMPSHSISKANPNFPAKLSMLSTLLVPLGQKPQTIKLRNSLIASHPNLSIHSTLRNAHIFFFPLWVLNFIGRNPYNKLSSVKEDVVELLAKASWQGRGEFAKKLELFDVLSEDAYEQGPGEGGDGEDVDMNKPYINLGALKEDYTSFITMRQSSFNSLKRQAIRDVSIRGWASDGSAMAEPLPTAAIEDDGDDYFKQSFKPKEPLYNGFYIPPFTIFTPDMEIAPSATTPLVRRVDTISLLVSTSLEIARNSPPEQPISPSAEIGARCTVTPNDCIIGDDCKIDEKVLIKRSVLGKKVSVNKLARVNGSVVLEGATIGEGSKLEGCAVGRFAKIGKGCTLVNCEIGEGAVLLDNTDGKGETFESEDEDDDDSTFDTEGESTEEESSSEDEPEVPMSPRSSKLAAQQQLANPLHGQQQQQQGESNAGEDNPEGEDDEEEDEDFEPSDSSFCDEEYDSNYESEDDADEPVADVPPTSAPASASASAPTPASAPPADDEKAEQVEEVDSALVTKTETEAV